MPKAKPVLIFDSEGVFIARCNSCSQAKNLGFKTSSITHVCLGKGASHRGHIFIYEEDYTDEVLAERVERVKNKYSSAKKRIIQYEMDGVTEVHTWDSMVDAESEGYDRRLIWNVLQKRSKHHAGYIWRYAEEVALCG